MASVSDLNIRLGLLDKNFSRQLAKVERDMRASVQRMGALGEQMTLSVSAPLGLIGGLALKTAAELESLTLAMTTTFESVGRGAGEAAAEINALRVAALAPGLDFEQAVKGSVRLQGVGISAEKARLILAELGNQIASTGGSADQLDAVTKQFSQIIGKGRLLQEDLSIILENMPGLARVLKEEFGTTSAEAIRALGVSAEDFIDRITNRMATMPRVAGGLANAFTNASVAIRQSLATVGEAINKTFNVTGLLDNFSAWILSVADSFSKLDGDTQAAILSVGAFALALGPAIKAMSLIVSGTTSVIGAFARVAESFRITSAAGTGTIGVFSRMNTAMKLNVFIAAASAILAIAAAFAVYSAKAEDAGFGAKVFAEAQQTIAEEVGREMAALNKNIEVLKSTTATTDERAAAINELRRLYPDYLRGVDLEKASLIDLTEIQGRLNSEILKGVAERQKGAAINKVYEEQAKILLRIQEIQRTRDVTVSEAGLIDTGEMIRAGGTAEAVVIKLRAQAESLGKQAKVVGDDFDKAFGIGTKSANKQYDALTRQRQALEDAKDALEDMTPAQRAALEFSENWDKRMAASKESVKSAFKESKAQANAYRDALASIRAVSEKGDVLGSDVFGEQATEITNQIERLIEAGFKPAGKEVQHLRSMLVDMRESLENGFAVPNSAQAVLAEMDRIDEAISRVNDAVAPIVVPVPFVGAAIGEIERVQAAVEQVKQPAPLVFQVKADPLPRPDVSPALEALQKIDEAISRVNDAVAPIVVPVPFVGAAIGEIERVQAAVERVKQPEPLVFRAEADHVPRPDVSPVLEALQEIDEAARAAFSGIAPATIPVPSTEAAHAAIRQYDKALDGTSTPPEATEVPPPTVGPALAEIQRVTDALNKLSVPEPLPLSVSSPAVPGLPAIPSLSVPTAVVQLDTSAAQAGLESLQQTALASIESNTAYLGSWQEIADVMVLATEGLNGFSSAMQAAVDIAAEQGDALGSLALSVGQAVADAALQGATSFGELANAAVSAGAKIVRAWIMQGVASVMSKAFASLPFPFNIAASAAAGGLAVAAFNKVLSSIGIPALAEGGVVRKPTLALIGEYPGASTNPEIVTPERKLRSIFRDSAGGGGGKLVAVVRGDDLQFILDRAAARRGRVR